MGFADIFSGFWVLLHLINENSNVFSGLAIALELGLLTGILFTLTQRLWLPIAFHIGWISV